MATVILGRPGNPIDVDLPVCVKTGRRTDDRVTLRGDVNPSWISVLLLLTIIGFLIAGAMTSRRYEVTLPFSHDVHRRWRTNRRWAWALSLTGVAAIVAAAFAVPGAGVCLGVGVVFFVSGLVIGVANGLRNNVDFELTRDDKLLLRRVHPAFADAVRAASTSPIAR